ncbi:MAG: antibiotic biosynthesis monooxygenase [Deltaproteobacteria bacterium]|nr:antibiotic biosynthesis monooxygenase [Deltaproteobacteria bacterium]MBW1925114.1 antibiotic biosynthesis monooxygenase [Deltaproteobacteria bacterium]MBW1950398.1 antibiotic biosynthesis monooxygenase [Deltaproteobacteria bacterium]MBW2009260.1 antibiotic biosynthesis monooxygenase [Deltaproteobacteria bacterium]MBW2102351.1 antibiotic biosynthesis monooxygenase [Deltaproteobacteria bacterium]
MITIVAKLKVQAGKEEALKEAMREVAEKVRSAEPGNLAYVPHQSQSDPTVFLFYEKYKDQAAIDFHRQQDHYKAFGKKAAGLLAGKPEVEFYEEI